MLERIEHHEGLALYWWGLALESWYALRSTGTVSACERALAHLEGGGRVRLAIRIRARLLASYSLGPTPVHEAVERVAEIRRSEQGALAEAWSNAVLGRLFASQGDIDRARELMRGARGVYYDAGQFLTAGGMSMAEARVELRAGDRGREERVLREGVELLERIGDRHGYYPTVVLELAKCLYDQGRYDEVERLCGIARETTQADDLVNYVGLAGLDAGLLAQRDRHEEAGEHARRAVELAETSQAEMIRDATGISCPVRPSG